MRFPIPVFLLIFLLAPLRGQQPARLHETPTPVRVYYNMTQLARGPALPEAERAGRKVFIQRCSTCHVGVPEEEPYGPWLNGELIMASGDDSVREHIMDGSRQMPGWRHLLKPAEIDNVIAYLKTVKGPRNLNAAKSASGSTEMPVAPDRPMSATVVFAGTTQRKRRGAGRHSGFGSRRGEDVHDHGIH